MLFVYSFAKHCKDNYLKALEEYASNASFCVFILKYFFVNIDSYTQKPFRINLENKDLILPQGYFDSFLYYLKDIKPGSVNEFDFSLTTYFVSGYESISNSK
jgi:hypothetical protein